MLKLDYLKKVAGALMGAVIIIPGIAGGFYILYMAVTALGN